MILTPDPNQSSPAPRGAATASTAGSLTAEDGRVFDALADQGFDEARMDALPAADRRRAQAIVNLMRLLEDYPVEDADDTLLHATLVRIDRHEAALTQRMSVAGGRAPTRRWLRRPDFVSVAAVLLIAASIGWPLLGQLQQHAIDTGCQRNLRMVAQGFSNYAAANNGVMPASNISTAGWSWDTVRNFDNLDPLIEGGYCDAGHLGCPGHLGHGPAYSYQLQVPGRPLAWGHGPLGIVLGDRNPLIDAARHDQSMPSLSLSLNHGQRGQNVIQQDGSVAFLFIPKINQDNIWLPDGVVFLQRGDRPRDLRDVFLTH